MWTPPQSSRVDGTDISAWSSRDPHDTRRGLGDLDARVGRGKKGFLLGCTLIFGQQHGVHVLAHGHEAGCPVGVASHVLDGCDALLHVEQNRGIVMRALSNPETAPIFWKTLKKLEEKTK